MNDVVVRWIVMFAVILLALILHVKYILSRLSQFYFIRWIYNSIALKFASYKFETLEEEPITVFVKQIRI